MVDACYCELDRNAKRQGRKSGFDRKCNLLVLDCAVFLRNINIYDISVASARCSCVGEGCGVIVSIRNNENS